MKKPDKEISAVLVLSHLMDANGQLGEESIARAKLAASVLIDNECDFVITSGWNYRKDSELKIGDVVSKYLETDCFIEKEKILVNTSSRDTVGDAFFIRKNIVTPQNIGELIVVTSDYHVDRTQLIFEKFFLPSVKISVLGVDVELEDRTKTMEHEARSLDAFNRSFRDVDLQDDDKVYRALVHRHPFYNGEVYEKVSL